MDLGWPLDESVEIDGRKYPLNLAFDNVLRVIDMLNDKRMTDQNQINTGLKMLIGTDLPGYSLQKKEEIFYQLYTKTVGEDFEDSISVDIAGNPMPRKSGKRAYSLKQDAPYIFAAFYQTYGIDLFEMQGKLHWKKFKALLDALLPNSSFREIVEIRGAELPTGKGTEERRKQLIKLKQRYQLNENKP